MTKDIRGEVRAAVQSALVATFADTRPSALTYVEGMRLESALVEALLPLIPEPLDESDGAKWPVLELVDAIREVITSHGELSSADMLRLVGTRIDATERRFRHMPEEV